MLKPSLQLRLGQQLTMTPQLQQAIRLLQLPALELQAHIRELLESNVMLEPMEESEGTGVFETVEESSGIERERGEHEHEQAAPPERAQESTVEVVDEGWGEQSVGPADAPGAAVTTTSGSRNTPTPPDSPCRNTFCGSSRSRDSSPASSPSREPSSTLSATTATSPSRSKRSPIRCAPEVECGAAEVEAALAGVQALDPPGIGARSVGECIELQLRQLDPGYPRIQYRH